MKITICGSMSFATQMKQTKEKLEELGHSVFMPVDTYDHISDKTLKSRDDDYTHADLQMLTKDHFNKIDASDAILVLNYSKNGIDNYIGASAFAETLHALAEGKKIFLLNPIPKQPYISGDLHCLDISVINGDLSLI